MIILIRRQGDIKQEKIENIPFHAIRSQYLATAYDFRFTIYGFSRIHLPVGVGVPSIAMLLALANCNLLLYLREFVAIPSRGEKFEHLSPLFLKDFMIGYET